MPVTDSRWRDLIVQQVGDTPDGRVGTALETVLWTAYADKRFIAPRLQYLYAKRGALDILLAYHRGQVNSTVGPVRKDNAARFDHLVTMRQQTQADIVIVESRTRANRAPATGLITAVAPIAPPAGAPDANSMLYRGSIYAAVDEFDEAEDDDLDGDGDED